MTWFYVFLVLLALLLALFLYSLLWGKPWRVRGLFLRTFLKFAFRGPELLTHIGILEKLGIHAHNAKFSDASEKAQDKIFAFIRRDLRLLRSYPPNRMSAADRLSAQVMEMFLEDIVAGEPFRHHDHPLNQMFGVQSELPNFMMTVHPVSGAVEAGNYIKRLRRFPLKFAQVMEGMHIRQEKGILPPRFVIRRVLDEMTAFTAHPPRENPLYTVFGEKLEKLPRLGQEKRERFLAQAEAAIAEAVYPAYEVFIQHFRALEPQAGEDDGVWRLPQGEAYYAYCLRSNTTTDEGAEAVHATGLAEVARIEAEMRAILQAQGEPAAESPAQVLHALVSQERFLFPNTDEGRQAAVVEYERILAEMDAALAPYFNLRPKAGLKVARVPAFREKTAPAAYYQPGDLAGARPGTFYANLRDMGEVPKFGMKTLAYHEGIPGHHFQIALAMELKGLPVFRRMLPFTAYAEGWAMYAERLAREIGMYQDDPYGELGALDSELFRAVRLVVDTGIHARRWTRAQAIEYMLAHTASAEAAVVTEVERYIVMPGQACAYKIGMLKMLALRERAREALGERFELRWFHDVILRNGSMPLRLLEQEVEAALGAAG